MSFPGVFDVFKPISTKHMALICLFMFPTNFAMKCPASLNTAEEVPSCPKNKVEWNVQARKKNCSRIKQTCVEIYKFAYHCVLNENGTQLLEVCAPAKYIHGQYCAEFNSGGSIIQESFVNCPNCPKAYISTESCNYQTCFESIYSRKENGKTTENPFQQTNSYQSDSTSETNKKWSILQIAIPFVTFIAGVLVVLSVYVIKRVSQKEALQTRKNPSSFCEDEQLSFTKDYA